jgi:hypothetical protein
VSGSSVVLCSRAIPAWAIPSVRASAISAGYDELIRLSGVKDQSSPTLADHFAGHSEVKVSVAQSVYNFGCDASHHAIDGGQPPVFVVDSFCAHHRTLSSLRTTSMTTAARRR